MFRIAMWLLVAGVLIGAVAGLWLAGEMHYRNCLTRSDQQLRSDAPWRVVGVDPGADCSRWPF